MKNYELFLNDISIGTIHAETPAEAITSSKHYKFENLTAMAFKQLNITAEEYVEPKKRKRLFNFESLLNIGLKQS